MKAVVRRPSALSESPLLRDPGALANLVYGSDEFADGATAQDIETHGPAEASKRYTDGFVANAMGELQAALSVADKHLARMSDAQLVNLAGQIEHAQGNDASALDALSRLQSVKNGSFNENALVPRQDEPPTVLLATWSSSISRLEAKVPESLRGSDGVSALKESYAEFAAAEQVFSSVSKLQAALKNPEASPETIAEALMATSSDLKFRLSSHDAQLLSPEVRSRAEGAVAEYTGACQAMLASKSTEPLQEFIGNSLEWSGAVRESAMTRTEDVADKISEVFRDRQASVSSSADEASGVLGQAAEEHPVAGFLVERVALVTAASLPPADSRALTDYSALESEPAGVQAIRNAVGPAAADYENFEIYGRAGRALVDAMTDNPSNFPAQAVAATQSFAAQAGYQIDAIQSLELLQLANSPAQNRQSLVMDEATGHFRPGEAADGAGIDVDALRKELGRGQSDAAYGKDSQFASESAASAEEESSDAKSEAAAEAEMAMEL